MKKTPSGGFKDILIKCGIGTGVLMLIFCTVSTIMIQSALKKFKHKMEDAGTGIETIVDKFKKAGEKYNEEIDNLKKDVASLKDGSPSKSADKSSKKDTKKSDEKKSEKSDEKTMSNDKDAKDKKADSKDEISFKDDKDAKKSSEI